MHPTKTKKRGNTSSERVRRWRLVNPERNRVLQRAWYARNKACPRVPRSAEELRVKARIRERRKRQKAKSTVRGRLRLLLRRASVRARKKGVLFALKIEDLRLPAICPVLGTCLSFDDGTPLSNRPSLDRIEPNKGYVAGNVQVISFRANMLKSNAAIDEVRKLLTYMEANALSA